MQEGLHSTLKVILVTALLASGTVSAMSSSIENRKKCLAKDEYGLCTKCNIEYFLEDNICYLCSNACKKCLTTNTCEVCMRGYVLQSDGKCEWLVFKYIYTINGVFIGMIFIIAVYGFCRRNNKPFISVLAGDEDGATISRTPQHSVNTPPLLNSGLKSAESEYASMKQQL
jgi:hypothetical protein